MINNLLRIGTILLNDFKCSFYPHTCNQRHVVVKTFGILDIIVVLSSLLVISFGAQVNMFAATTMKSLRFLQILRLVRVDRKGGTWKLLSSVVMAHRKVKIH